MANMEKTVLQLFLHNTDNLHDYLASNSILEWFGRSVKGRERITQYFRDQIVGEFEHNFSETNVIESEAFEEKTSHFLTKTIPPENRIKVPTSYSQPSSSAGHDRTPNSSECSLITPPKKQFEHNSDSPRSVPPLVRQGRRFLSLSEDECEGDVTSPLSQKVTSTPKSVTDADEADSSQPLLEDSLVSFATKSDEVEPEPKEKKSKIDHQPPPQSSVPGTVKSHYSDLKYLEAIGLLRIRRKKKHRGVIPELDVTLNQSTEVVNPNEMSPSSATAFSLASSGSDCYERKTKLKISYRIHKADNKNVQFALILYEYLAKSTRTRRNLMLDFQDPTNSDTKDPSSPDCARKIKKRTHHLKRQLRL